MGEILGCFVVLCLGILITGLIGSVIYYIASLIFGYPIDIIVTIVILLGFVGSAAKD